MRKRILSFVYAMKGIREMIRFHTNFKIQLFFACLATILGILLHIQTIEFIVILLCIGIVLALETINSAVEFLVNFINPEFHPIAGKIKDLSAGAVLIFCIFSLIIVLLIFLPYFLQIRFS